MKEYLDILGYKVRDRVTGFVGVATSVCFDLYGCVQVVVRAEVKDGKIEEGSWFDHKRLEICARPLQLGVTEAQVKPPERVMPMPTFEIVAGGSEKPMPRSSPLR